MKIREVSLKDLRSILELEKLVWGSEDSATPESMKQRIEQFPEGFCVAYDGKKLVGMAMSALLPLNHEVTEYDESFFPWERIHDPNGEILYLYCSTVHPDFRSRGIWKKMLNFRVDYARTHPEIKKIWVAGRTEAKKFYPDTATLMRGFGFKELKKFPFKGHCNQALLELNPPYTLSL